MHFNLSNRG